MENNGTKYDAILIGSGIGALTCAAILARFNHKKVLVLERHYALGGFTHEFMRKGKYKWDVGLHYIGEMHESSTPRRIMDYITNKGVKWNKMPYIFDKFIYPDFTFGVPSEPEKYLNDLIALFPEEKNSLQKYFRDVKEVSSWFQRHFLSTFLPAYIKLPLDIVNSSAKPKALITTQQYLDSNFKNSKLKSLLVSQWGDYGLPPKESAFATHANIVAHYLNGAYYPEGGAGQIAKNAAKVIESAGGKLLVNREVSQIITENNTAIGVFADVKPANKTKEEYYAPVVISDTGAYNTYLHLLPGQKTRFKEEIASFPKGYSAITLYIAFKESPEKLGFKGENHWIFSNYEHGKSLDNTGLIEGNSVMCFLSFPSLKDPSSKMHIAEAITFSSYTVFEKWKNQPWLRREKDYYELKDKISQGIINLIESHYPGFKELIEYQELSTPLTIEHFSNRHLGEMYGIPGTPERYLSDWCNVKTPIKNLYLTGSDTCMLGIVGAMWGGVATASILNGQFGFFKLLYAISKGQ